MGADSAFARLAADLERERTALGRLGPPPQAAEDEAFVDEVWASTALAGSPLRRAEVAALMGRGLAVGDRPFDAYVLVADYGEAARFVRAAPGVERRRPYLREKEIVELHALATRRAPGARPGTWRTKTMPPFPSGMVVPPPWLVPREIAAFVERHGAGPPAGTSPVAWVAAAHARFERIHPFATANGRVGRLVANLLLRRLGLPPLIVTPRDRSRYLAALRRADAREPWPLAELFARSLLAGVVRLRAAHPANDALVPLADLAPARERAALYKAAQRGRLITLRRGGTLFSTPAWVAEYRASRYAASGRPSRNISDTI